jgi:hypothetical protein
MMGVVLHTTLASAWRQPNFGLTVHPAGKQGLKR